MINVMAMKMGARQNMSASQKIRIKPVWLVAGGVVVVGGVVFLGVFLFNILGTHAPASAASTHKYPFDTESEILKRVHFTVLDPAVNSVFAEVRPLISGDGKTLFFSRRNYPDNIGKEKDFQDIWFSSLLPDGRWSAPSNAGPVINSKSADAVCSVSADGSEIVFIHEEMSRDNLLMRSKRSDKGWSEPVPMIIENYYSKDPYVDFFFSFDTNILLMALTRKDSEGEQDLYVSKPAGTNKWSEPLNLGPVINSAQSDFAPFLAGDGKTLFFVSYGHNGLGGCDIFKSTRLDDTWQHWSEPVNVGEGINSEREESYFSVSGDKKFIYFESYDVKHEVRDIFRADLNAK